MISQAEHWDRIFATNDDCGLGWYENDASPTLQLLEKVSEWDKPTIFLPGAGTSVLIDALLKQGAQLVLNDISLTALDKVRKRVGNAGESIDYICQDISQPLPIDTPPVDIWIDRAVLHFLTDEESISGYFENLKSLLNPGGYALFAEFSKSGAEKCAGLTLHRYSVDELSERLGSGFELMSSFDHIYLNPNGDQRPYIYTLYKKLEQF